MTTDPRRRPDRDLDLVLLGASGFVGRLTAAYLARAAPAGTRVALAGRSLERLATVRDGLGPVAHGWPLVVADSSDDGALAELAARTTAVASTVGPYTRHGLPLVAACAAAGTHYADLTGEVLFVRESIERHHEAARASGARIVHACGFDSVPSDLGVLLTAERAREDGAGELLGTTYLLVSARGGFSGGTVDSLRTQIDAARADPAKRRVVTDPYALSPDRAGEPQPGDGADAVLPGFDAGLDRWVAPFVMAPYNTRVVRRSNALTGWSYGRGLRYRELLGVGQGRVAPLVAGAVAAGSAAVLLGLSLRPTRRVLDRLLPAPGHGPDERSRRSGHFRVEITAATTSGARYRTTVAAQGDPGYAATSVMLGEAALALALDELPPAAGVLTPATGIGTRLATRLRAAGFTLDVERL